MDIDDPRAARIAEAMANKTSKKILNLLADREMSGSEIAEEMGVPLNTVTYNLKKLVGAGLIEKVNKVFWSSRGKKMELYKVSNKQIVISPRTMTRRIIAGAIGIIALLAIAFIFMIPQNEPFVGDGDLKQFGSLDEIENFVNENVASSGYGMGMEKSFADSAVGALPAAAESSGADGGGASDYSETNVQVEGVDEPDIVKNDGKYIYVVSGNKVVIVDAFPAEEMETFGELEFENGVSNIFINDDKLVVFTYGREYVDTGTRCGDDLEIGVRCGSYPRETTKVLIYDVSDRENPELDKEVSADGYFVDARMIGDYVYLISSKHISLRNFVLPMFEVDGIERSVAATDVYYFDSPDNSYIFNSVTAIDIDDGDVNSEVYLMGSSRTIYVSEDNIYLTYQKRFSYDEYMGMYVEKVALPILPNDKDEEVEAILDGDDNAYEKFEEINGVVEEYVEDNYEDVEEFMEILERFELDVQRESEKTIVHKIGIDKLDIDYKAKGEVPGRVLNQFSMDEFDGTFRIATTTGNLWEGSSLNHLYVLDGDLEIIGSVEDLAQGEKIYSVRFMGERAYIVTFKKVDPLFVIDLSDARDPEVLGYLKITGYSDYLHPYDENHVIGIGKETVAPTAEEAGGREIDFAWYQGVKISLFDVSDVEHPVERAKIIIGDRGTESYALHDHKAFLFDKERELLVIPIALAKISEEEYGGEVPGNARGERVWQGAFVLDINLDGISERGRITHYDDDESLDRWYYGGQKAVQRSLYMDDVLYTISQSKVMAHDLESIEEINGVVVGDEVEEDPWIVY